MKTLTFDKLVFLENPQGVDFAVKHELCTVDDLEDAKGKYETFLRSLEQEWPPERIREYVVQDLRNRYQQTARFIQKLELDNRDARVRGVSYKDRQSFTAKIKIGHDLVRKIQKAGTEAKRANYHVRSMVRPTDTPLIFRDGFEKHLQYTVLGGL